MDPDGPGSIFGYFGERISPENIWQVPLLRMECKDLLTHLDVFDQWRINNCRLRIVK